MKKFSLSFKLAVVSQIISLLGGSVLQFTILLFIRELTSPTIHGLAVAISAIPLILFTIPGGIVADRKNKKKCIVALDFTKTLISIGILVIFLNGTYSIPLLIGAITFFMALITLFNPILTSSIPTIVDEGILVEANGIILSISAISHILGVVLAGILFTTVGISTVIILCGVLFLTSTIIDLFIKIPYKKSSDQTNVSQELKASFRYVAKENPETLKITLTFACLSLLYLPIFTVAFPNIALGYFGVGETVFGFAQAFTALGMIIGGLASGKIKKWLTVGHFFKWILLMGAFCLILAFSVSPVLTGSALLSFWIFNIGLLLIMVVVTFGDVLVRTTVQEKAPAHLLGKVISLVILTSNLVTPIGQSGFGWLIDVLAENLHILFIVITTITVGVGLITRDIFGKTK